jgi:NOL1/NOP2/fmu family ribosome biogenesis protein
MSEESSKMAPKFEGYFDKILVDAPCSGEGMFRKDPAMVKAWGPEKVELYSSIQREIIVDAAKMLKPGGMMIYSTCTFAPEEDEGAVEEFLRTHPDFVPESLEAPWFEAVENGGFRMWPHKLRGEGHFAAVLRRIGGEEGEPVPAAGDKLPRAWTDFAKEMGITLPAGKAILFGQSLYWAPEEMPALALLKVLRPGLELGEVKKGRFEPAHALALWLKDCSRVRDLAVDSAMLRDYMHGDVIESAQTGWCLVTVEGYSIGWGKGDGRVLKNHYPKGLRR